MHVGDFYAAEVAATTAIKAARTFSLEQGFDLSLSNAAQILAEVRHFAYCWDDNRENVASGAVNGVVGARIEAQLIERLVLFCKPERV